jgi:hypothetical protein
MSIQIVSSYLVGQKLFPTIEEAQKAELTALFEPWTAIRPDEDLAKKSADKIVEHADEVIAILTCQPKNKKPRSDKGKKRASKENFAVP